MGALYRLKAISPLEAPNRYEVPGLVHGYSGIGLVSRNRIESEIDDTIKDDRPPFPRRFASQADCHTSNRIGHLHGD